MRYGYWLPIFGGWLRNVEQENMAATWEYASRVAIRAEEIGFDLTLVAELNLNDIKGANAPSLDAWSTAAALAAVTKTQEIMVAVRPTFHSPALLAKQAANIDHISNGRLSLNVVSSWWADEAKKYGVHFEQHDDRYARTEEWLTVLNGVWQQDHFSHEGRYYRVEDNILQPKPVGRKGEEEKRRKGEEEREATASSFILHPSSFSRPLLYAGGESEAAKNLIARTCDGYVMHGDPPEKIGERIRDMNARRERVWIGTDAVRRGGVQHCARHGSGSAGGKSADNRCKQFGGGLRQLSAMAGRHEVGTAGFAGGLFGQQSRAAFRVGGNAQRR